MSSRFTAKFDKEKNETIERRVINNGKVEVNYIPKVREYGTLREKLTANKQQTLETRAKK